MKMVFFERHNVKCIFMKDKIKNNIFQKMFIFGKTYWKSLFANDIFFTGEKIEKVLFFEYIWPNVLSKNINENVNFPKGITEIYFKKKKNRKCTFSKIIIRSIILRKTMENVLLKKILT